MYLLLDIVVFLPFYSFVHCCEYGGFASSTLNNFEPVWTEQPRHMTYENEDGKKNNRKTNDRTSEKRKAKSSTCINVQTNVYDVLCLALGFCFVLVHSCHDYTIHSHTYILIYLDINVSVFVFVYMCICVSLWFFFVRFKNVRIMMMVRFILYNSKPWNIRHFNSNSYSIICIIALGYEHIFFFLTWYKPNTQLKMGKRQMKMLHRMHRRRISWAQKQNHFYLFSSGEKKNNAHTHTFMTCWGSALAQNLSRLLYFLFKAILCVTFASKLFEIAPKSYFISYAYNRIQTHWCALKNILKSVLMHTHTKTYYYI